MTVDGFLGTKILKEARAYKLSSDNVLNVFMVRGVEIGFLETASHLRSFLFICIQPLLPPTMISVIIPTFNEETAIANTVAYLKNNSGIAVQEIIVADGGSSDKTVDLALNAGATVISCATKGRAAQMNAGAAMATGKILYFLHADTLPPKNFDIQLLDAHKAGYLLGCYRLQFDYDHWFLRANAWFTRFDINAFRFGDQSLFVDRKVFELARGFDEKLVMLEDQEIIRRLRKHGKFIVMPTSVITSSRKYIKNGVYKTQAAYFIIYFLYQLGFSQQRLLKLYRKLIVQDKL